MYKVIVEKHKCCLCGKIFDGYGNDPYPLVEDDDTFAVCCDECNIKKVVPTRLALSLQD